MSITNVVLSKKVSARDLFGERLKKFGIREEIDSNYDDKWSRCLTDGSQFLVVLLTEDGFVDFLSSFGADAPRKILHAICEAFGAEIFSQHEPQFWVLWDAAWKEGSRNEFYFDIRAYIRGETNNLEPGTIGAMILAKKLVEAYPTLLQPENKERLLGDVDAVRDPIGPPVRMTPWTKEDARTSRADRAGAHNPNRRRREAR